MSLRLVVALVTAATALVVCTGSPASAPGSSERRAHASTERKVLLDSTELVDLQTGSVSAGPRLSEGEYKIDGAVAALPDGRVVVAGGRRIDVYDPANQSIMVPDAPTLPRLSFRTASVLDAQTVFLTGGYDASIVPTDQIVVVPIPL